MPERLRRVSWTVLLTLHLAGGAAQSQQLESVFPPGIQAGAEQSVSFSGPGLGKVAAARCSHPGITFRQGADGQFLVTAEADTPPGLYDVQAFGSSGLSSTRAFFVTRRPHRLEAPAPSKPPAPDPPSERMAVPEAPLGSVVSGRIGKGEIDQYRFRAARGDQVVIECWAERIDSALRAVLELTDERGRVLGASRGFFGVDPVVTCSIPADGEYTVRLFDLIYAGGDSHFYRLDIGVGPRVLFVVPPVVQRGVESTLTVYGWNLKGAAPRDLDAAATQLVPVAANSANELPQLDLQSGHALLPLALETATLRVRGEASAERGAGAAEFRHPAAWSVDASRQRFPDADAPLPLSVTDVPVVIAAENRSPSAALPLAAPVEACGQLTDSGQRDWYSIEARRGEVFYVEAFGQRIGAPVDLDLAILDASGERELAAFHDERLNTGGTRFPTSHLDPGGRWVAPSDGRYLMMIRDLIGGIHSDPRRVYRLSVRREAPTARLVALADRGAAPSGLNVPRGGRAVVDVLAFRQRGFDDSIRIAARGLPEGLSCPDIWIGPGVSTAPLVFSAAAEAAETLSGAVDLVAESRAGVSLGPVQSGIMIRGGASAGLGRPARDLPLAIAGAAPLQISADGNQPIDHHLYGKLQIRHSPGGVLDVAVQVWRQEADAAADVKLRGAGLPPQVADQRAVLPAGQDRGHISFYLPPTMQTGMYTLAIRADTTITDKAGKERSVVVYSNPVTFEVHPPMFRLEVDLDAPRRIGRGEVIQVGYALQRRNGFLGKVHTELAAPGRVTEVGHLRARGVTTVGQSESGTIQIVANDDAELGEQKFLRLLGVGVLEDEPLFFGSCWLRLEIVE